MTEIHPMIPYAEKAFYDAEDTDVTPRIQPYDIRYKIRRELVCVLVWVFLVIRDSRQATSLHISSL